MATIRLKVGEERTLTITNVIDVEGENGPQLKFEANGDALYLSEHTAGRQFARLNVDPRQAAGQTFVFSKVQSGEKTYINVNRPKAGGAAKTASNGNSNGKTQRALVPLYGECLDYAQRAVKHHVPNATSADIVAAAATLFIQAVRDGAPLTKNASAPKPVAKPKPAASEVSDDFEGEPAGLADEDDDLPF